MELPDSTRAIAAQPEHILLGMLVWGEGRGESPQGKRAIAETVVTRAAIKKTTPSFEALRHNRRGTYHYSCFMDRDPNRHKMLEPLKHDKPEVWQACLDAAKDALAGLSPSPAKGATHYLVKRMWLSPEPGHWYSTSEIASGRTKKVAVIGGHVFAKCPF